MKPCKRCGGTERYVRKDKLGACKKCGPAKDKISALQRQLAQVPCKNCGGVERYANGQCKVCSGKIKKRPENRAKDCAAKKKKYREDDHHTNGLPLGIICDPCNTGTGLVDSIPLLESRIAYLKDPPYQQFLREREAKKVAA